MKTINLLIPCFNDQNGLEFTLSRLDETCDINVFIVDDGSKSHITTPAVLTDCVKRIDILRLSKNLGLISALNFGIDEIQKKFGENVVIARIDCGDAPHKNCFSARIHFFEDPKVLISACSVKFVDVKNPRQFFNWKVKSDFFPLRTNFIHSGIIYKPLAHRYKHDHIFCEDVFLFHQLSRSGKARNVEDTLLTVFQNDGGISTRNRRDQLKSFRRSIIREVMIDRPFLSILKITYITLVLLFNISKDREIKIKGMLR